MNNKDSLETRSGHFECIENIVPRLICTSENLLSQSELRQRHQCFHVERHVVMLKESRDEV